MLSTYELEMLAKLGYKQTIEKAETKRFSQSMKKRAAITTDQYRRFVVREERPCYKKQCVVIKGDSDGR